MKKIIIIYQKIFLNKDFQRFEIDFYLKKNLKVEIWDIFHLLYKDMPVLKSDFHNNYKNLSIENFSDSNSFKKALKNIDQHSFVMTGLTPYGKSEWIFLELQKNSIIWGYFKLSFYPIDKLSLLGILKTLLLNQSILVDKISSFKRKLINFFRLQGAKKNISPKFIIYAGNKAKENTSFYNKNDLLEISAHSYAYNEFLLDNNENDKEKDLPDSLIGKKYILYIDEDVPNHKDPYYHGFKKNLCEKEIFYKEIKVFFKYLENKYNCKVVIATYPRAEYNIKNNPYERIAYKNKTLALVKNSFLILQHNSTAVTFSVIFNKPIIFMTSRNYLFNYRKSIESLAKELGTKTTSISKDNNYDYLNTSINEESYSKYFTNYITSNLDEANKTSAQITYEKLFNFFK
tara:strand:+ start:648 stop:1853 length:1206 start_codon:yes stop_codon:yes gene_type:complete